MPQDVSERDHAAAAFGINSLKFSPNWLCVQFTDGGAVGLSSGHLYFDAPERFDARSGQRIGDAVGADRTIASASALGSSFVVKFDDGSSCVWTLETLSKRARSDYLRRRVQPWRGGALASCPVTEFLQNDDARRRALAIVARDGVVRLNGAQASPGVLETVVRAFGFLRETNYGRLFDVRVTPDPDNLAFTDKGLAPHTDNPYREPPPGLQLLHCMEAAGAGGETILVDGFAAAETLRTEKAEAFALLCATPVRFFWRDADNVLDAVAPVIELGPDDEVCALRVNDRALAPLALPHEVDCPWRAAYRRLCALTREPSAQRRLTLEPGDVIICDNRRILHGRTAFSHGARWLQGCYADMDGLLSKLAVLEGREADARADAALSALAGPRGDETYGEGVTLRAHALQCAALASRNGLGAPMTAAALLHDIGWTLGGEHEITGADWVEQRFGVSLARPIRAHVSAKRYLVTHDPEYHTLLSDASRETLIMQGGPMTETEARAFEATPGAADALALRRIDDQAKDAAAEAAPLEAYRGLLVELATRALRTEEM